ncbi:SGNH/GDSL hydrolase family protein [Bacillus cereus group sp. Bc015]|uniref:SGNH/GDSL hydrolase family protein n=1 Tax=Bacillus cereus group sp. Bc015 TaxID=3018123 RepID=UPI0022E61680|nr:SGNH/GDSL hydrolase family protein [Bacillus cereus group sp. Bc015]MDA2738814.1 SGNH/GDSL hydrolase family protein [Bacillus cereus group sp. Bc015]
MALVKNDLFGVIKEVVDQGNRIGTLTNLDPDVPAIERESLVDAFNWLKNKDYRKTQSDLYAKFYRMIRKGEPVKICFLGDSMTYGQDSNSPDKRPIDNTVLPDGSRHVQTRASITYPEAVQNNLNKTYGVNKVTVLNRGYSGDGTKKAYERWITSSGANMTAINFGVNDSRASWVEYNGDIPTFLKYYRKLIERELDWGSAVIILTPPKMKLPNEIDVYTFSNAVYALAAEYGIPVVDTDEFTANHDASCYSDGTHMSGKGYNIYGAKLSSIFVGEGAHKLNRVYSGSKLLVRPTLDNIVYNGASLRSESGAFTPPEDSMSGGLVANIPTGGSVTYSFYTCTDDVVIVPVYYKGVNSVLSVELDYGVEQSYYSLGKGYKEDLTDLRGKPSGIALNDYKNNETYSLSVAKEIDPKRMIHVAKKGWHTLRLHVVSGVDVVLNGLEFIDYQLLKSIISIKNGSVNPFYKFTTHNAYTDKEDVLTSDIDIAMINKSLGLNLEQFDYWKSVPFKITVINFDESIFEYIIHPGGLAGSGGWKLGIDVKEIKVTSTPNTANQRKIKSISYNGDTKILTVNWSGATTRATSVIVSKI